jgi:hypothetical protein
MLKDVAQLPPSINRWYAFAHPTSANFGLNFAAALVLPLQGFWLGITYMFTTRKALHLAFVQPAKRWIREEWVLAREAASARYKDCNARVRDQRGRRDSKRPAIGSPKNCRVEARASDSWGTGSWDEDSAGSRKSLDFPLPFKALVHPPRTPPTTPLPPPPNFHASSSLNSNIGVAIPLPSFMSPLKNPNLPRDTQRSTM